MLCPNCNSNNDTAIDSRPSARDRRIRRRRECLTCGHRFTTMEINRADLSEIQMKGIANKGECMEQEQPLIVMIVTTGGVSVLVNNTEGLRPDQLTGFHILADKVRSFAAGLVDHAIELQASARKKAC